MLKKWHVSARKVGMHVFLAYRSFAASSWCINTDARFPIECSPILSLLKRIISLNEIFAVSVPEKDKISFKFQKSHRFFNIYTSDVWLTVVELQDFDSNFFGQRSCLKIDNLCSISVGVQQFSWFTLQKKNKLTVESFKIFTYQK